MKDNVKMCLFETLIIGLYITENILLFVLKTLNWMIYSMCKKWAFCSDTLLKIKVLQWVIGAHFHCLKVLTIWYSGDLEIN